MQTLAADGGSAALRPQTHEGPVVYATAFDGLPDTAGTTNMFTIIHTATIGGCMDIAGRTEHSEEHADKMRQLAAAVLWREAAVADGWSIEPTYASESVNRAATLKREGYVAMVFTRTYPHGHIESSVSVWGPDGLALPTLVEYDWPALVAGLRTCLWCNATDVDTQRVNFAGRVCATCLPEAQRETEKPGWTS